MGHAIRPSLRRYGTARIALISAAAVVVMTLTACASPPDIDRDAAPQPLPSLPAQDQSFTGNLEYLGGASPEWIEATARYDACMKSDGWAFRDGPAGAVFGFPEGQQDAFAASDRRCNEESGRRNLSAGRTLTEADQARGHAQLIELQDCLTQLGYTLSPAPSLQVYLQEGGSWSPYLEIPNDEAQDALESCPQSTD